MHKYPIDVIVIVIVIVIIGLIHVTHGHRRGPTQELDLISIHTFNGGNDTDTAIRDREVCDNDTNENNGDIDLTSLQPGQQVLAVICVDENGQLVIVQITVLDDDDTSGGQNKVLVCHKPDKKGGHTISIAEPAVPAHLAHGDILGACP